MEQRNRVHNIINQALVSAGVDNGRDLISITRNQNNDYNINPRMQKMRQVHKKLDFNTQEKETLINKGLSRSPITSSLKPSTGSSMPMIDPSNDDERSLNNNCGLNIFDGPSGPALELVTVNSNEDNKTNSTNDYSIVQIGMPNTEFTRTNTHTPNIVEDAIANREVELSLADKTMAEHDFETPDNNTPINTHIQRTTNSTDSNIVEYSKPGGSKTHKNRKCKTDKIYLDYLSDQDFSTFIDCDDTADSDEWLESTSSSDDEKVISKTAKSKQSKKTTKVKSKKTNSTKTSSFEDINEGIVGDKGMKKKRVNVRKDRSAKRAAGKEFERRNGKVVEAKTVQPNPCSGKKCGNNCENIESDKRQNIFDHFWGLSADRRRDWLVSVTQREPIKRKRVESEKRTTTFKYFINEGEGRRSVCLQFLSATLNISSKTIYYTAKNANWGCAREDLRGKHVPPNKTKPATIETVTNFIKSLPAVPSHYCRHDSTKVYLNSDYKNVACVYTAYKKRSIDHGIDYVSERVFRRIFSDDFNIGFHVPKKDKCLKCLKFEQIDITNTAKIKEKQEHEIEKTESYNRFSAHKHIHKSDPNTLCVSFDLEKVLNTPHGESMLFYYSRKLAVYNLCFYENGTRKVFCYYWDESHGKRGANEISSILNKYILLVDTRGNVKNLLLYCDCCPGQNRNRVVLAMIHSTLQQCKNLETIQINYLLTGHTYMPVDSVHAVIESNLSKAIVYAPSQWYTIFSTARKDPFPYEVENLTFEDFYKWDLVADKYFKGNLTGKISKVRIVTFKKSNLSNISVKYSMNKAAKSCVVEIQSKTRVPLLSCYRSRLPIAKLKYDDLTKLCKEKVIPAQFQKEFSEMPSSTSSKDVLPESDIEDMDPDDA